MAHIDYYLTTLSPYVYLAGTRLEEIAARHGATIRFIPLDAGALFARTGGTALADRHESRKEYRLQELRRQSRKAGLPLELRPPFWPTNGAPSNYAVIAAQAAGEGDVGALVHGFGRACWAEGRDIAEDGVIRDVLVQAGFDPGVADRGLLMAADTYASNLEAAVTAGVFGVPFYVVGEERFWGQDRLDDLDAHLSEQL
ncbi:2-hydroxychromene-2-carboxylate isomerase [Plastorhodobacter daqingensis]|uniref:2-hydroxychromene-2-carboxylate isomerase n=1 Tax=Plastorhodobacter daqingensis TaxID=1387281 RepID=A0ABW2UPE0_9RHOB